MPEPRDPGDLPPDVPPEYADAYLRGYERALQEGSPGGAPVDPDAAGIEHVRRLRRRPGGRGSHRGRHAADDEPTQAIPSAAFGGLAGAAPDRPVPPPPQAHGAAYDERDDRSRWLVPVVLAAMALLLVGSAYGLGRVLSAGVDEVDTAEPAPDGINLGADSPSPSPEDEQSDSDKPGKKKGVRYRGPVDAVAVAGSNASCRSDASVDAAGRPVRYPSTNAHDGNLTTAWRCDGSGSGETLTLRLPQRLPIGEVGLVPGYAKTDSANGVDRYAENNRITKVRWRFSDGSTYVQTMNGDEDDRSLRRKRIPRTSAKNVTIEIVSSVQGPRNTVAVSEVWVASATG